MLPAGTYTLVNVSGLLPGVADTDATLDLDITDDLTINGADAATTTIDQYCIIIVSPTDPTYLSSTCDRIFEIAPHVTAEISNVTIAEGRVTGPTSQFTEISGGGLKSGHICK
jgi:hypothetical protein